LAHMRRQLSYHAQLWASHRSVERESMRAVFVEYAWDMGWCDAPALRRRVASEDLVLMETPDHSNFQSRYVLRRPWPGAAAGAAGERCRAALPVRFKQEAKNLAGLTGWSQAEIETRMEADGQSLQGSR